MKQTDQLNWEFKGHGKGDFYSEIFMNGLILNHFVDVWPFFEYAFEFEESGTILCCGLQRRAEAPGIVLLTLPMSFVREVDFFLSKIS